ncbi:class I SAM-dependent methyltransferase [Saccharothrix sp. NPDC042600]|uniref:O-methyltransferase n=1 Tax=Saccharothrix TaxID=2071 RepID=UPI0033E34C08
MQRTSALEQLLWDVYGHVRDGGAPITEGFASLAEVEYLADLARTAGARTVAEIGFNIGFSAIAFLESSPEARVVSFELDQRRSVALAKEFVDVRYPGRHELVVGDSTATVPAYGGARPDLVFVDGGHTFEIAYADLVNARRLARPGALVVVDDVIPWYPWGVGPHRAWTAAVEEGLVEPVELHVDGRRVEVVAEPGDRAWATGRFTR